MRNDKVRDSQRNELTVGDLVRLSGADKKQVRVVGISDLCGCDIVITGDPVTRNLVEPWCEVAGLVKRTG